MFSIICGAGINSNLQRKLLAFIARKRRHFFNRRAALEWLEIEAPAIFPGRIERMELCHSRGMLIWKKINNESRSHSPV
jgi:hypothetical protein